MTLPKWFLQFLGDVFIQKFPFFIMYKPALHKIKGYEIRQILDIIQPADILFRTFDGYLNSILTPGTWSHAGLYIGDNKMAHAVSAGVVTEDILDFCRTDNIALCRFKPMTEEFKKYVLDQASELLTEHIQYDYDFKDKNGKLYCTEFVNTVFNGVFYNCFTNVLGNSVLTPDDLKNASTIETLVEFKH